MPRQKKKGADLKGIVGVGNLLMGDEGFGIHVIKHLEAEGPLPQGVELLDGGTAGMALMGFFQGCSRALIIDVINIDQAPGTLVTFSRSDFGQIVRGERTSPHQIGILELLDILDLNGTAPHVEFLCAAPGDMKEGLELSPQLKEAVPKATEFALDWAQRT